MSAHGPQSLGPLRSQGTQIDAGTTLISIKFDTAEIYDENQSAMQASTATT
jgi:hypothetical protein